MFKFEWQSGWYNAHKDSAVLKAWEQYEITTQMAIRMLKANNGWQFQPTPEEFRKKAAELGYHRYVEERTRSEVD